MDKFNFDIIAVRFARLKMTLPMQIANITKRRFTTNFDTESFDGNKWQEVKRRLNKYAKGAARTNPILQGKGSGILRRSMQITEAKWDNIKIETIGIAEAYADVHNEGLRSGRGIGFTMPKRQFMGESDGLNEIIKDKIARELSKIF